jgi:TonB family protein
VASFGYADTRSRPFAVIQDEQEPSKTLLCAMMADDEGAEVVSLYHQGEIVQVFGEYMGTLGLAGNPSMPTLRDCKMASPTDRVVRPAQAIANDNATVATETKDDEPDNQVYRVGADVSAPRLTHRVEAEYTDAARKDKLQGTCELEFVVGKDGHTQDIRATSPPIGDGLDEKAMEAVQQWRFDPALKDGKPVAVRLHAEVTFRLY